MLNRVDFLFVLALAVLCAPVIGVLAFALVHFGPPTFAVLRSLTGW